MLIKDQKFELHKYHHHNVLKLIFRYIFIKKEFILLIFEKFNTFLLLCLALLKILFNYMIICRSNLLYLYIIYLI